MRVYLRDGSAHTILHAAIEVADPTFHLTQSQYTDTGPISPSTDPIKPGAWQDSHRSANFYVTSMTRPRKISGASGIRNPGSSTLEANAWTIRPTRRWQQKDDNDHSKQEPTEDFWVSLICKGMNSNSSTSHPCTGPVCTTRSYTITSKVVSDFESKRSIFVWMGGKSGSFSKQWGRNSVRIYFADRPWVHAPMSEVSLNLKSR